jgi:type III secretory pathway component EscR
MTKIIKVVIKKSTNQKKKYMAIFYDKDNKKVKTTHFGATGYSDFTKHKDEKRKERYIKRHQKNNQNWNDYTSAGSLSRYILWNKVSLIKSIKDYKRKFRLK